MSIFLVILVVITAVMFVIGYLVGRNRKNQWSREIELAGADAVAIETQEGLSNEDRIAGIIEKFSKLGFEFDAMEHDTLKFTLRTRGFFRRTWGAFDVGISILAMGPIIPALLAGEHFGSRKEGQDGEQLWYSIENIAKVVLSLPTKRSSPTKRWWRRFW